MSSSSRKRKTTIPVSDIDLLPHPSVRGKKKKGQSPVSSPLLPHQSTKSAAEPPESDFLPDPSVLGNKRKSSSARESIKKLTSISSIPLTTFPAKQLENISEDNKIAWAISTYGCSTILHLSTALNSFPPSLTSHQRTCVIKDAICPNLDGHDIASITSFLEDHALLDIIAGIKKYIVRPFSFCCCPTR